MAPQARTGFARPASITLPAVWRIERRSGMSKTVARGRSSSLDLILTPTFTLHKNVAGRCVKVAEHPPAYPAHD
jgi:hypothetical protein